MAETTVSSKYQVVIPKAVRERTRIKPGDKLTVIVRGRVMSLVPRVEPGSLFGMFPGLDPTELRDEEDRL